jgi:hypothetical protein
MRRAGNQDDPLVMGVGWLWREDVAVASAELVSHITEAREALARQGHEFKLCVVQGAAIDTQGTASGEHLTCIRLQRPAMLGGPLINQLAAMSPSSANLSVERGRKFEYVSYAPFRLNDRIVPVVGYDPLSTWIVSEPANLLLAGETAVLTSATTGEEMPPPHAGGLVISAEDQEIVGTTLPNRSVLWSDQIRSEIQSVIPSL